MSIQSIFQSVSLFIFIGLLAFTAYPFHEGLAVDFFLRMDPLVGLTTMAASRTFAWVLAPGLVILGLTLLFGRFFCGHICPMGTTLEGLSGLASTGKKRKCSENAYPGETKPKRMKYVLLVFILVAAIGGISLAHVGSPISLVTRFYALVAHPILLLLSDLGLRAATPALLALRLDDLAYTNVMGRIFYANLFVGALFLGLVAAAVYEPRFWCRNLCPSGALMGLFSMKPLVRRNVTDACINCGKCIRRCPMGAIPDDPKSTATTECITCGRCVTVCPVSAVSFATGYASSMALQPDLTRRGLLWGFGSGLFAAGLFKTNVYQPRPSSGGTGFQRGDVVRPPGAVPEGEFLAKCIRCGECMKACPTNGLQPIWCQAGLEGIFSPMLLSRIGACTVNCNTCGQVCPTGAIRDLPLPEKNHAKLGSAWINRRHCLVWEQDKKCLVCDEVCPYSAISFERVEGLQNPAPVVHENRCLGCGWCENKCPVNSISAIRVAPIGEIRLSEGSYTEKAERAGMVFKKKDKAPEKLAPGLFEGNTEEPPADLFDPPTENAPGFNSK